MKVITVNKSFVFRQAHEAYKLLNKSLTFSECLFIEWLMAKNELSKSVRQKDSYLFTGYLMKI